MPILAWTCNDRCNTFRKTTGACDVKLRSREIKMASIEPKLRKALTGISGILVTPFDAQDKVAPDRLTPIVDRAISAGVHILFANGNTGGFYGLTPAEPKRMVHAAAEQTQARGPGLARVGRGITHARRVGR